MIAAIYARKSSVRYLRILGALFGLRILTTSARGEGAWVIWVHSVFRSKGIEGWVPAGSADSLDECKRAATTAMSNTAREVRAQNDKGTIITQTGSVVEFAYASGDKASIVAVCLPDTVDPRGPKR
jgi:hypothetical protein